VTQGTNWCDAERSRKHCGHGIPSTVHKLHSPSIRGARLNQGKCTRGWLRLGTARLTLAIFILLGLMFGTSLGYLALAALRGARSTEGETEPVVTSNIPNPPPGSGWEDASYAAREHSSREPPKVPV
jgi:hypothetical protein